jgi:hypothetical protein
VRKPYRRVGFTAAQSAELWERWKEGSGLKAIARVLGKSHSCIFAHMYPTGGIRPPPRKRSRLALSLSEREEISRSVIAGRSVRAMAEAMVTGPRWRVQVGSTGSVAKIVATSYAGAFATLGHLRLPLRGAVFSEVSDYGVGP